jgi:arylsulfatase A-like enzyme
MSNETKKPNIVFILSDDQGEWATGCSGNKEIHTPNIDFLAENGMRFKNFFCTSPVCSPARASLLTGRIPSQHGIHDWIRDGNSGEKGIEYLKGMTGYTEILRKNGYECGMSGKWHMGLSQLPQKGFSHWYVHQKGGGKYYGAPMIRDGKCVVEEEYITDLITDDAIQFIEDNQKNDKPFYVSIHYTAPHSPWIGQHPKEYVDYYKDCPFESCPRMPNHPWDTYRGLSDAIPKDINDNPLEYLKGYFAAVTAMDANIGRVIDALKRLDIFEDTLIIFLSDNGFNCGHHGFWGKGNGTFPMNMYDTSIRVPAIFCYKGKIKKGIESDNLLSGYDFMPTLIEYLDMENRYKEKLPGKSFAGLLEGKNIDERKHVVVFDEYGPVRMIRTKEWKYVHRYPYGPSELYDLSDDPDEGNNLIDVPVFAEKVSEMKSMMEEWFIKYTDPRIDGTKEAVKGDGQVNLAGVGSKGKQAYI